MGFGRPAAAVFPQARPVPCRSCNLTRSVSPRQIDRLSSPSGGTARSVAAPGGNPCLSSGCPAFRPPGLSPRFRPFRAGREKVTRPTDRSSNRPRGWRAASHFARPAGVRSGPSEPGRKPLAVRRAVAELEAPGKRAREDRPAPHGAGLRTAAAGERRARPGRRGRRPWSRWPATRRSAVRAPRGSSVPAPSATVPDAQERGSFQMATAKLGQITQVQTPTPTRKSDPPPRQHHGSRVCQRPCSTA